MGTSFSKTQQEVGSQNILLLLLLLLPMNAEADKNENFIIP